MKFIDLTTKYIVSRERLRMGICVGTILTLSILSGLGMYSWLESEAAKQREERNKQALLLRSEANIVSQVTISESEISESSEDNNVLTAMPVVTSAESSSETVEDTDNSSDDSMQSSSIETATSVTTTAATTTTATTTTTAYEVEFYATVYASSSVNLRSGPGTGYSTVRTLSAGERIDVVARTQDGWYKTINGNYVMSSYTTSEPPATTAATTAQTTAAQTTAAQTTAAQTTSSSGSNTPSGMTYYGSCRITFYGPQPLGDGTYSTTTATGTTCSEGRTVAADWSIFPAGTTIYIANDPLGGDGYYTVEDRGGGVRGNHIDIYADDGESRSTTSAEVYIVN